MLVSSGVASVTASTTLGSSSRRRSLEPDVLEHKYYADGVGLVLTIDKEGGGREELLSVTEIPPAQARRARLAVLGQRF